MLSAVTLYSIYLGLSQGNAYLCLIFYAVSVVICVGIKPKIDDFYLVGLIFVVAPAGIISYS